MKIKGQLLSEYFIEEGIKETEDWKKLDDESIKSLFNDIKKLYFDFYNRKNPNEANTEDDLISPILKKLGFYHLRQKSPSKRGRKDIPDFLLFANENQKKDFINHETWNKGVCIVEAKRWLRILDKGDQTDPLDSSVPSNQILRYLSSVEIASNGKIVWGILTNGKDWRLYYQRSSSRSEDYLEINFDDVFGSPTPKLSDYTGDKINGFSLFKIFILFFRKEAFIPTEWRTDKSFLEIALDEGKKWEKRVSESLKNLIFKDVFPILAKGFYQNASNEEVTEDFLGTIYENTLIFLYRLLFLFYAEDRGLLPVNDSDYYEYSLTKIRKEIAQKIDENHKLSESATSIWDSLKNLTSIINKGDSTLGVPPYNGGLFKPELHSFLSSYSVPDSFMAPALDKLSRDYSTYQYKRISYRDLSVRQLGSIYEGLLEFKLKKAETDLKVTKKKGKEIYEKTTDESKATVKKGEIYLTNDKSERKATGSYYTPEHIVDYIIKNTLGPIVEEKWRSSLEKGESLVNATLSIKVLDPAMGSGHFLVDAIEFLAGKLLEAVQKDIEAGFVDNEYLDYDSAKREVLAHCIYGVDFNYLAVELAKVSLWLTTISKDKPLSFLDHRLKKGNSLIGSRLSDLKQYPDGKDKESNGGLPTSIPPVLIDHLISKIKGIEKIGDNTLEDIQKKEEIFKEFKQSSEYSKTKAVANVYTAMYFGNEVKPTQKSSSKKVYYGLLMAVMGDQNEWRKKTKYGWFRSANQISQEHVFFHWELEFPEVFLEKGGVKENPGFDVLIGNPPWGELRSASEKMYFKEVIKTTKKGKVDMYPLFVTSFISLTRKGGFYGLIIPNTLLFNPHHQPIRKFILKESSIRIVYNLSKYIFDDAPDTVPAILVCGKERDKKNIVQVRQLVEKTGIKGFIKGVDQIASTVDQSIFEKEETNKFNPKLSLPSNYIFRHLTETNPELREFCIASQGIKPYATKEEKNEHEYLSFKPKGPNWVPALRGRNIERYSQNWDGEFVLYGDWLYSRPREEFEDSLCLFYQRLRKASMFPRLVACLAHTGEIKPLAACSVVKTKKESEIDIKFILALINSRLINEWYRSYDTDVEIKIDSFLSVPIRNINFVTPSDRRDRLLEEAKQLYQEYLETLNEEHIINFVQNRLPKDKDGNFVTEKEESDIVHDLLVYLAEQMTEMNEEKNREVKEFIEWFESYTETTVDDLKNKTKLKQYYNLDFKEFFDILKKNKKKIPVNIFDTKKYHTRLKDEFEKSISTLSFLIEKIEATDKIIDKTIYKLYGLTDEEVKIIEESIR